MNQSDKNERIKEFQKVIFVLLGAVLSAFLIAGILVYRFSPSSTYTIDSVLIDPEVVTTLTKGTKYTLDDIGYRYFQGKGAGWVYDQVSTEEYSKFFDLIRHEKNLRNVDKDTINQFFIEKPASVIIKINSTSDKKKSFTQEIQILTNGFFRVQLHQSSDQDQWAYFYQDQIYQKTNTLFTSKP